MYNDSSIAGYHHINLKMKNYRNNHEHRKYMADVADESKMGPNEKVVKDFVTKLTLPLQALIINN